MKDLLLKQLELIEEFGPLGFERSTFDIRAGMDRITIEVSTIIINDEPMAEITISDKDDDMLFWRAMPMYDCFKEARLYIMSIGDQL